MGKLVRKTVTVRGKRKSYRRTVMVRATKTINHMDGLTTGLFLRKHGKYYGKMQLGIGASAAAGGLSGWALANAVRSSNTHRYVIGGYIGGAAASGAHAVKNVATTEAGRSFMHDYNRLSATQRRLVRMYGVAANATGHIGVVGTAAAAYRLGKHLTR